MSTVIAVGEKNMSGGYIKMTKKRSFLSLELANDAFNTDKSFSKNFKVTKILSCLFLCAFCGSSTASIAEEFKKMDPMTLKKKATTLQKDLDAMQARLKELEELRANTTTVGGTELEQSELSKENARLQQLVKELESQKENLTTSGSTLNGGDGEELARLRTEKQAFFKQIEQLQQQSHEDYYWNQIVVDLEIQAAFLSFYRLCGNLLKQEEETRMITTELGLSYQALEAQEEKPLEMDIVTLSNRVALNKKRSWTKFCEALALYTGARKDSTEYLVLARTGKLVQIGQTYVEIDISSNGKVAENSLQATQTTKTEIRLGNGEILPAHYDPISKQVYIIKTDYDLPTQKRKLVFAMKERAYKIIYGKEAIFQDEKENYQVIPTIGGWDFPLLNGVFNAAAGGCIKGRTPQYLLESPVQPLGTRNGNLLMNRGVDTDDTN